MNDVLKALSNPIRRDIVALLRDGPMSAGDIAKSFSVSKPTMSAHFAVLKDAELIIPAREGTSIIYRLNATVAEDALTGLMDLFGVGQKSPPIKKSFASKKTARTMKAPARGRA